MQLPQFFRKTYYPLNTIEISKNALLSNYQYLSGLEKDLRVAPVLKSNAYGHGISVVGKLLDGVDAPFLCVDSLYEGYELLKSGVKTQILIMGYINPENLKVKKLPFAYAVYDRELAVAISMYQPGAVVHIFVDTGMHREGVELSDLSRFLTDCRKYNLRIEGLMSHFGESENYENIYTQKQIENFKKAREIFADAGVEPKWVHISNSSGMLNHKKFKGKIGNVGRCGIALYGIDPEGKNLKLRPVLKLRSLLCQVKSLKKGERVGYSFTYKANKDMIVGLLPIGYYDGVDRRLSNKGFVQVKGVYCPIIGRVSMNLTCVDLSNIDKAGVGESVTVFSDDPSDKNSVYNASVASETIAYDLLVHLASSTKRVVV